MRICLLIASFLLVGASACAAQECKTGLGDFLSFIVAVGTFYLALIFVATGIFVVVGG